jgi:hypothetical protein
MYLIGMEPSHWSTMYYSGSPPNAHHTQAVISTEVRQLHRRAKWRDPCIGILALYMVYVFYYHVFIIKIRADN